jgi:hypothetical protein
VTTLTEGSMKVHLVASMEVVRKFLVTEEAFV